MTTEIINGDCLTELAKLADASVDAVITDPPFSSGARTDAGKTMRGTMLRGARWEEDWFSHDNMATHGFMFLMRLLGSDLLRVLKPGGTGHFFIDWRMYPNLYGALESCGWLVKNLVVWDKQYFGMGSNYRNQHELIIYAEKPGPSKFKTHSLGNVINCSRPSGEHHPTEKPVELLETLIEAVTDEGDIVLDPFTGSGSTGVACVNTRRKFIGFEISPQHHGTATARILRAKGIPATIPRLNRRQVETLPLFEGAA